MGAGNEFFGHHLAERLDQNLVTLSGRSSVDSNPFQISLNQYQIQYYEIKI